MRLLQEAGLPDGVINLLYGRGAEVGDSILADPALAGVHFTGSTAVFQNIWRTVGGDIERYANYPRIVGETGGKDFMLAHRSADVEALVAGVIRGAFEYQGQKCSAASRLFVPASLGRTLRERLVAEVESITMGDLGRLRQLHGRRHRRRQLRHPEAGHRGGQGATAQREILAGGESDDSQGYFVRPTVIVTRDPSFRTLREELFGPVLTTYVYDDADWEGTLKLVDSLHALRPHRRHLRPRPRRRDSGRARRCATRPATSTSTTSRPAPSSASSPSAAPAPRAPTTRPAPSGT